MFFISRQLQKFQPQRLSNSINWSNPITNGLVAFFDTGQGYDRVTQQETSVNTASFNANGRGGRAAVFASTTNMQFADNARYNITGPITILSLCDITTLSNFTPIISKIGTSTTNMPYEFRIGSSPTATTARLYFLRANAAGYRGHQASTSDLFTAPRLQTMVGASSSDGNVETLPKLYLDRNIYTATTALEGTGTGAVTSNANSVWIGRRSDGGTQLDGRIYFVALWNRQLTDAEYLSFQQNPWQIFQRISLLSFRNVYVHKIAPQWVTEVEDKVWGTIATADNSSISSTLTAWEGTRSLMQKSVNAGQAFDGQIVSTYSLVYTVSNAYGGGVLDSNGDIHFIPFNAAVGQKINSSGVVSTYSLVYTTTNAYTGGVLAPNGDVHFVPLSAAVGQKISSTGTVSTYSLVYTTSIAYAGGVLAPNGDIHFVPTGAVVGQKISSSGTVSTYSLVYPGSGDLSLVYSGGVIDPNGDIHFVPRRAPVGQKISLSGVVSTYSLIYTLSGAYNGGVLAPNGDIHFVPLSAVVGQKISASGVVSTYSLVYTATNAYTGGVLAPNGDIFYFVPLNAVVGQNVYTLSAIPFEESLCLSPFLNKL